MRDLKFTNTLPDPENHPFFTEENNEEETHDHWLVRLLEWNVSRWLRRASDTNN